MDYEITESPQWRRSIDKKSEELVRGISDYIDQYEALPDSSKEFCKKKFWRAMAVDYIFNLNVGELVGTQTKKDTKRVLEELWTNRAGSAPATRIVDNKEREIRRKETMNTYNAMEMLHQEIRNEMEDSGLLTVQRVCDVHKVLLDGLHNNNGNLRRTDVYTRYNGEVHYYPPVDTAEQRFYDSVDSHNEYMDQLFKANTSVSKYQRTANFFKCAARLMFELVDAHPFSDGNGRMCRLLANHVLSHITPFPVVLYHSKHPNRCSRIDYIEAIVKCRNSPNEGPSDLAAMLVDGAWIGWKCLFDNLRRHDLMTPGVVIGPIVVQKSKPDHTPQRVTQLGCCI